jgi:NDP-sugar pyrophosphorylase family protein/phosphomannomutase
VGKEVILYGIEQLVKSGVNSVTLAVGYGGKDLGEFVENQTFDNLSIDISHCSLSGTAPAVRYCAQKIDDDFFIIEGNCIFDCNLALLMEKHRKNRSVCTALLDSRTDITAPSALVGQNGDITDITESPTSVLSGRWGSLTGIYAVSPEIFDSATFSSGKDFTADIITELIRSCSVKGFCQDFYFQKIITPQGFLSCQQKIMYSKNEKLSRTVRNFSGATLIPPVYIGENVTIRSGAVIGKGTVIDDGAYIGSGCRIYGSYVGKNTSLESDCEMDGAVICETADIGMRTQFGMNSVVGFGARIESDCIIRQGGSIWQNTTVKSGTTVNEKITHGTAVPKYIDDFGDYTVPLYDSFTVEALRFGMAVATAVNMGDCIVTGHSGKNGSATAAESAACGVASCGANVLCLGKCTRSQLDFAVGTVNGTMGLYFDVNGHCKITVHKPWGLPLECQLQRKIEQSLSMGSFRHCTEEDFGEKSHISGVKLVYENSLKSQLPLGFSGLNASVKTNDEMVADIADRVFRPLNDIDGERVVFQISYSGDRCTAYSVKSGNVTWERLVCLAVSAEFEKGRAVSLPFEFTSLADEIAENYGGKLYRYFDCSDGVTDKRARETASNAENMLVRDGLRLAVCICKILTEKKISLSEALKDIPNVYSVQRYVPFDGSVGQVSDRLCGIRVGSRTEDIYETEKCRAVIRTLKNGAGIRIFAESFMCEQASALCDEIEFAVKSHKNQKDS